MSDQNDSISALTAEIREFARERDWEQFHDPKSLILALVGEVGELAELFQWVPAADAMAEFSTPERKQRVAEEIADVFTYLLRLADVLDIDVRSATSTKLVESRARFAVDGVRGVAPRKQ